jgi:NADPH-dependent curcumin reductase CurA
MPPPVPMEKTMGEALSALSTSVYLKEYVRGTALREDHFELRQDSLRPLADGEALLETLCLSVDPYLRGCMTGMPNFYLPQLDLGGPVHSLGVARIAESRLPGYAAGELVVGNIDWSTRSVLTAGALASRLVGGGTLDRLDAAERHPSRYLGVLGQTGITAFFGIVGTARVRPGETVVVSAAAGAVGSVAGQIAKILGARVIGLASSAEKRSVLTGRLGFDAALDYRSPTLADDLRAVLPSGPDIYFDNVGGQVSQAVMSTMRRCARVIECGQISSYDDQDGGWTIDIRPIHARGLVLQSFTPSHFAEFQPAALAQLRHWLDTGRIVALETVHHGIESAPVALAGLFRGGNLGKAVVKLYQ